jgi:thymidylate kinase
MSLRNCTLVAVDGTHASGKTTLVHALTAHYRQRGVLVDCTAEPARTSPFIEDIVIHGQGDFDLPTEVDLFAAQISATLRAARHQQLLICDKTLVNVLAYARMVLPAPAGSQEAAMLDAMATFCRAWAPTTYDLVLYLPDHYSNLRDPFRAKVAHLQDETARAVRSAYDDVHVPLLDVPVELDVPERVTWIARRVDPLLQETDATLGHRDDDPADAPR